MSDNADFTLGTVVARLDALDAEIKSLNAKFDEHAKAFQLASEAAAAEAAVKRVALTVGGWVLTAISGVAGIVGAFAIQHWPWLTSFFEAPKPPH